MKLVDAVKGLAIVLVVYGHVCQGVGHRGWWDTPLYFFLEHFIYSFHMAAFFFVSGLFLQGSLAKYGSSQFVLQRLRTVLWPYLFIALCSPLEVFYGAAYAGSSKRDLMHSILLPILTGDASWFLPTLFVCLLLAMVSNRLPDWARLGIAIALNLLWPKDALGTIASDAAKFFVFLAVGEWIGRRIHRLDSVPRWAALAGSALLFLFVAAGNLSSVHDARPLVILLGLSGTLGLFLLVAGMRNTPFEAAAAWCGIASLGIYVLHPLFQGAMRVLMARLTSSHAVLLNTLPLTLVAVVGPGLLWHFRRRLHIGFLFEFPWGAPRRDTML